MLLRVLLSAFFLWPAAPALAVIGGRMPEPRELPPLAPVVELMLSEREACTATHLGDGWLLTARHCDHGTPIEVRTLCGNRLAPPAKHAWRVPATAYLEKLRDQRGRTIEVPQPDIALLRVPAVAALPRAAWAARIPADEQDAEIAGFGFDVPGPEGELGFALGRVHLSGSTALHRRTVTAGGYAGVGHGDSGGPLFVRERGRLAVFAVVSSTNDDEARHVRLDAPLVQEWLTPVLAALPAPPPAAFGEVPELPIALPGLEDPMISARREEVARQRRCLSELSRSN